MGVVSEVKPNNTLGEFATWGPEWSITFDMELKSPADNDQWYNLFQFTANDKHCCDAGDRVPGVWFVKESNETWLFTLDFGTSYSFDPSDFQGTRAWHLEPMNIGQWYDVQICMKVIDSATDNGLITLTVDGNVVYEVDAKLIQYDNVKWYQSNPWDFDQTMEDKIEVKNMVVNDHEAICTTDTTCSLIPSLHNIVGFVTCFLDTILG